MGITPSRALFEKCIIEAPRSRLLVFILLVGDAMPCCFPADVRRIMRVIAETLRFCVEQQFGSTRSLVSFAILAFLTQLLVLLPRLIRQDPDYGGGGGRHLFKQGGLYKHL